MFATWLWNEGWRWKTRLVMLEQCLTLDAHLIEDHRRTELSWVMIMMNSAENFWPIFLWNRSQDVEGSCFVALCRSIILPLPATPTKKTDLGGNEEKGQTDSRRHIFAARVVHAPPPPPYSWENCRDYFCVLHNPFNFFLQASAGCATLFAEAIRFRWGHQSLP